MSEKLQVRCPQCCLLQFERPACRRCAKRLPAPIINYRDRIVEVEKEVIREVPVPKSFRLPNGEFQTFEEVERDYWLTLLKVFSRSPKKLQQVSGIGKTTVHRKIRELGGGTA